MNVSFPPEFSGGLALVWIGLVWLSTAIVHFGFAWAVLNDSYSLLRHHRRNTTLVGGSLWALATLFGGVFVAAVYWLVHHSTLCPQPPKDAPRSNP